MRKFVLVSMMALCVAGASAANLQLFFSETPWQAGMTADDLPAITNPEIATDVPVTLYIWAMTERTGSSFDTWNGINLDLVGAPDATGFAYNPMAYDEFGELSFMRWHLGSDFTFDDGDGMLGVGGLGDAQGLGKPGDPQRVSGPSPITNLFFPLAEITFQPGDYEVYLAVGPAGIGRQLGSPDTDLIFFGAGDAGVLGNNFGAVSEHWDLRITPEPASLILLSLAGLFLRRR